MKNANKILKIFLLFAALAVISLTSGKIFNHQIFNKTEVQKSKPQVLTDKTSFFKDVVKDFSYYEFDSVQDCYFLYNSKQQLDCFLLLTSPYCDDIEGFGGCVPFAIIFNPDKNIRQLYLFENSESESWTESLKEAKFFDSWNGLCCKDAIAKKVDAVSGATFTSTAVIESMNRRMSKFAATAPVEKTINWSNVIGVILSFFVLIFAVLSFLFPQKTNRFRLGLLIASVGILGFWQGKFISIALLNNWLINGLDIWPQVFLLLVLFLSILLPIITNKSFYCQFLCPFGAAQELVGKLNKKKIIFAPRFSQIIKTTRFVLLFVVAVLAVVAVDVSLENFEPFSAFKFQFASLAVLILAIIMLFMSVFFAKPWCRFFCPTGALLSMFIGKVSKTKEKSIKITHILNIVLAISILLLVYINFIQKKETPPQKMEQTEVKNNTLEVIHSRKSVRNYTDQEVTKDQLEVLVKAGMAAPSARNLQPWAFIVVQDRNILNSLADSLPHATMLKTAQAAIVVCGDLNKAATDVDRAYWVQDCSAATENILLAAEATGLGAVWTAAYPYQERMNPVINALNLPDSIIPLNVIPIGYPTGDDKPKDKWNPENMHWNGW